jgi:glucuronate isomerase
VKDGYLLTCETAKMLYKQVGSLPVYDYHCHLSPREIYLDEVFENIGKMWLENDHYMWRLMRVYGIDEDRITGGADWLSKFLAFAECIELAAGSPLYHWVHMELSIYFDIDIPLNKDTALSIWHKANSIIKEKRLSPKKLIKKSGVAYIATTDDIADSLEFHKALRNEDYEVMVAPSFRTDNLLLIRRKGYAEYIKRLSDASGICIDSLSSLKEAVLNRLAFFKEQGCRFSDIGIPFFPDSIASEENAQKAFSAALAGEGTDERDYLAFLGHMYLFLGNAYRENNIVMQWHLAVERNANTRLFEGSGADSGGDCMGDVIPVKNVISVLDGINNGGGLPETVIYTLNPSMTEPLASVAGCFRNVHIGTAWWFNDHKDGIAQSIRTIARGLHLGKFLGMLTDSRSFLSYARHDYFRRILCSVIGEWAESGEFLGDSYRLCEDICCGNIKRLTEGS